MAHLGSHEIGGMEKVLAEVQANPALLDHSKLTPLKDFLISLNADLSKLKVAKKVEEDLSAQGYIAPSGEDTDDELLLEAAQNKKAEAAGLAEQGKFDYAITLMTEALQAKPSSAMWWAFRADIYLKAGHYTFAVKDASQALERNPDSARALRVRGLAHKHNEDWEKSVKDLSASQNIDFNEAMIATIKEVEAKAREERDIRRKEEEARQERLREQRRKEQEEAEKESQSRSAPGGGMPGGFPGGFPGGMPNMGGMGGGMRGGMPPGMEQMMQDPELQEAMKDPEVMQKLSTLMTNPAAAMQMMGDPKMGPILQKLMAKMGGGMMGGMGAGAMPGGFNMGGAGAADPSNVEEVDAEEPAPKPATQVNHDLD